MLQGGFSGPLAWLVTSGSLKYLVLCLRLPDLGVRYGSGRRLWSALQLSRFTLLRLDTLRHPLFRIVRQSGHAHVHYLGHVV